MVSFSAAVKTTVIIAASMVSTCAYSQHEFAQIPSLVSAATAAAASPADSVQPSASAEPYATVLAEVAFIGGAGALFYIFLRSHRRKSSG